MTTILQGKDTYFVEALVGENKHFRYYRATSEGQKGRELILKIGTTLEQNGLLDKEAYLLSLMADEADCLEVEYKRIHEGRGSLNYKIGFPIAVETFIAQEQGARRVLVLAFEATDSLVEFAPLSLIRTRDHVRVDPKTSAWVMGKLLKIIAFAHGQGIKMNDLTGDDILVIREHHLVTVPNWSSAILHKGKLRPDEAREDIRAAACEVVTLLGGNPAMGTLPEDEQLLGNEYAGFLAGLVRGVYNDAHEAHSAFYQLVEVIWGRAFHSWTTYPLNEKE